MPTILMKSRTLNVKERMHRLDKLQRQSADRALSLEIRANMTESKQWEVKFDDYGRQVNRNSLERFQISNELLFLVLSTPKDWPDL
jgi:hypothetical protein